MFWMKTNSYSFTYFSIFLHAPVKPGIYAIRSANRWIYVGETDNIRESLHRHVQGDNPWIAVWEPSAFCYEMCLDDSRVQKKNQLVAQLRPAVTDQVNGGDGFSLDGTQATADSSVTYKREALECSPRFHRSYFDPSR